MSDKTRRPVRKRRSGTDAGTRGPGRQASPPTEEAIDREELRRARLAWYYYVEGLTQAEIAERFGLTRLRVNRLLNSCREDGLVQIRINSPFARCVALEADLTGRFALRQAVVVPSPAEAADIARVLGAAAGEYIAEHLTERQRIGIGWGRTLRCSLRALPRRPMPGLSVVSLLGGLTRGSTINAYETAWRMADLLEAECYYLAAPAFAGTAESRDTFLSQEVIRDVYQRARQCDLALVSVGDLSTRSTIRQLGLIGDDDAASLRAAGAVGDLLGHYLDVGGRVVDHPINRRVVALGLDDLKAIPMVVLASGGPEKLGILRGALTAGYADALITDENTAEALARPEPTAADDRTVGGRSTTPSRSHEDA